MLGLNEIQTYSFCSQKSFSKVNIDEESWEHGTVKITNPLGEETGVLRTVLTPNMMEVLATNYKKNVEHVRAYEIGNTFVPDYTDLEAAPEESENMTIGIYGSDEDFFTLKGIVERHKGECSVFFHVKGHGESGVIRAHSAFNVTPSEGFVKDVTALLGNDSLRYSFHLH